MQKYIYKDCRPRKKACISHNQEGHWQHINFRLVMQMINILVSRETKMLAQEISLLNINKVKRFLNIVKTNFNIIHLISIINKKQIYI